MSLKLFLKDKVFFILCQIAIILFIAYMFSAFGINLYAIIFICTIISGITFISLFIEYYKRNRYYKNMYSAFDSIDKKQYIISVLDEADFADGQVMYDFLKMSEKAMNDEIMSYRVENEEYREYIEMWIHEIKIPISVVSLMCENNRNDCTRAIAEETLKIEKYIEQALYYARSTNVENDYSIRTLSLDKIVKGVVRKYSKELIACKTKLEFKNLDYTIFTDQKWIEFVIGQVISNSIKYRKEKLEILFSAREENNNIILAITDNGIGIPQKDIKRVTEKGFTGENGRKYAKSTGIGLYLCKKLCAKMYLGFNISSVEKESTTVEITFPKDKFTMLID